MSLRVQILLPILFAATSLAAQLRLPALFSDGMVLQQQKPVRVWGWAAPNQGVSVKFKGKKYPAYSDASGQWSLFMESATAGHAGDLLVQSGAQTITLHDVLVGEVWVCSGQSNMEWTMGMLGDTYRPEMDTVRNPDIRFVTLRKAIANRPLADAALENSWAQVDSHTLASCSAVAYWYGRALQYRLHVPVGLIITSWGGTPAQPWVSYEGLHDFPGLTSRFDKKIRPLHLDHIETLNESMRERFRQRLSDQAGLLAEAIKPDFDDSGWEDQFLPGEWEEQGHPNLNGFAIYRLAFYLDESLAAQPATLHIPPVDDMDSTYINGVFLGSIYQWDALREYAVPEGILKAGRNVLVIKVQDDQGGGGLMAREEVFNLAVGGKTIPLAGKAKFRVVTVLDDLTGGYGAIEHQPSILFNAMIAPLLPYAIRGVIWYQGESNADNARQYRRLFPALIRDWRYRWGQGDFPFLFVQLSSFGPVVREPSESDWAQLREAQTQALTLPNTAMAVSIDIGNPDDIHPHQKKEVGERLAAAALRMVYAKDILITSGPKLRACRFQGNRAILEFDDRGSGLMMKGKTLNGFCIAGADGKFVRADARIVANRVEVASPIVPAPLAVRYGWADSPVEANLYNHEGFPALPFRTDDLPDPNPVIAHRGAWKKKGLPENSLASLRAAIDLGCAGSEFDVRMTADDSLVINHDPKYHDLPIETTRYAELAAFPLANGEKLPTLRSYLLAGMNINTETMLVCEIKPSEISKERGREIAARVVRLVDELDAWHMVVFISFDYDILVKIRELNPDAATQYLEGDHAPADLLRDGIDGADFHLSVYQEHPDWIDHRILLNAWTVNEPADMNWLLDRGFDYITTNEPELLLEICRARAAAAKK
ncbi:MAG: sialate O-acetylesterase [Saprospiraceae bacterium]